MGVATFLRLVYNTVAPTVTDGKDIAAQCDANGNLKTVSGGGASGLALETGGNLATLVTKTSPVATVGGIAKTAQDATTAHALASNACVKGFYLYNMPDSAGVLYYAPAGGTAPTSAGANATGFIVPGDCRWIDATNTNTIQVIASATTTNYAADVR